MDGQIEHRPIDGYREEKRKEEKRKVKKKDFVN